MNYISIMTAAVVVSAFLLTGSGVAQDDKNTASGLYFGVDASESRVHDTDLHAFSNTDSGSTISSDDDTAQNAFVGYKYNPYFSSDGGTADIVVEGVEVGVMNATLTGADTGVQAGLSVIVSKSNA